jgi:hypothetical protein
MQGHRNEGPPHRLPDPDSLEYRAQKTVLLELVVTPPPDGDSLAYLVERLPIPDHTIEPAIAALERVGLAIRAGDLTRASPSALYFEHLWPVRL